MQQVLDPTPSVATLRVTFGRLNALFAEYSKNLVRDRLLRTDKKLETSAKVLCVLSARRNESDAVTGAPDFETELLTRISEPGADTGTEDGVWLELLFRSDEERAAFHSRITALMQRCLGPHLTDLLVK